ncbi:TIGR03986 family CRISPR-associated RAMP protein [Nocardiopsis sp. HNM0947]|uniref:TIGR03986 family CRISPR-associated RAMP protein n=1 Tax=Nocardiopsis coralli TaxID=2772213 RepID=A0ABR9P788_9ACTN|nr:TIGR03986 family CRISPR-associated RAMP protein [Nocardiopsis coralli]MBE2999710.1 TIGR03986 family CRISPR-associated RAMP protein [Nocardiopsis coralli]
MDDDPGPHPGPRQPRYTATAPYGLVPLADAPLPAADLHDGFSTADLLRSHDRTVPGTHTGWIDLTVTTLTPTYVGRSPDRGHVGRSLRLPVPGGPGLPVLPGASLRGLLRNTVRMLTGGETGPVNTPMLYFRAPVRIDPDSGDSTLPARTRQVMAHRHAHYRKRRAGLRTRQGFLHHATDEDRWYVVEVPPTPWSAEPGQALKLPFDVLRRSLATWDFGIDTFPDPPRGTGYVPTLHPQHGALQHRWVHALHIPGTKGIAAVAPTRDDALAHLHTHTGGEGTVVPGLVVLTGPASAERRNAYLFARPHDLRSGRLPVPDVLVELFESAEQITDYQRLAFPDHLGTVPGDPERAPVAGGGGGGLPRSGVEPVWFDQDLSGAVVSFGRSGGYRIAVSDDNPIRRAVPPGVLGPQRGDPAGGDPERGDRAGRPVDVPRALFGDLDTFAGPGGATRGRIQVGDAVCESTDADLPGGPLRVRLLSPQRGCFANYLLQGPETEFGERPDLVTWSHEGRVRLGGYKVYLHRHPEGLGSPVRYDRAAQEALGFEVPSTADGPPRETQRDVLPLRDGLAFRSRITFTNLTGAELGALLRALVLDNPVDGGDPRDPEYAHKIGMGKALGLGSVHLGPELHLVDRRARALSLDPGAGVRRAGAPEVRRFLDAFDSALTARRRPGPAHTPGPAHGTGAPHDPGAAHWRGVDQARDVCLAARWRHRLPLEETAVMSLREFAEYPVLPPLTRRFSGRGPPP